VAGETGHAKLFFMVNSKEFRVGNFILVDGIRRRVASVGNEGRDCIGFELESGYDVEDCNVERLQAVPVDNVLLKELGFIYHDYFKLWQRERPDKSYSIELSTDFDALDFSHNYMVRNIQFLHQLQNLFFCVQGRELFFDVPHGGKATPGYYTLNIPSTKY
jgi:hypothetical protein